MRVVITTHSHGRLTRHHASRINRWKEKGRRNEENRLGLAVAASLARFFGIEDIPATTSVTVSVEE